MAILETNRDRENAAYEVINKEHKRNTQEDMDMDDEFKGIEDEIRSRAEKFNNQQVELQRNIEDYKNKIQLIINQIDNLKREALTTS